MKKIRDYNMLIEKAFKTKKEILAFKKDFTDGKIHTEVLSNLLNPVFADAKTQPFLKSYLDFIYSLPNEITFLLIFNSEKTIKSKFGKYDFKFEGNRTYYNYIFKYKDLLLIGPQKIEAVSNKDLKINNYFEQLIEFDKEWKNLIIEYTYQDENKLPFEAEALKKGEETGLLKDGKINFNYKKSILNNLINKTKQKINKII
jgi:hypothetical protein